MPGEVQAAADNATPSYTVATLERQRRQHGTQRPLVLLLGADAFGRLESWQRWRDLFELAHIAVATRPGHDLKEVCEADRGAGETALAAEFAARRGVAADLAARAGRAHRQLSHHGAGNFRHGDSPAPGGRALSVRYLVPDPVLDYIETHQLYRTPHGH